MIKVDELKIGNYDTEHDNIAKCFRELDDLKSEIDSIMNNGKWQGSAYETCSAVLAAVYEYQSNFYADYQDFTKAVSELCCNVDTYASESQVVAKLV